MSEVSQTIRNHHRELLESLSAQVKALVEGAATADPEVLARFLREELLPHAIGEEKHLYPAVEPLIMAHGRATATMSVDHEFIADYIRRIGEAAAAWAQADEAGRPALQRQLQHLALQLEAVLRVHLEKEERVYLPLFEEHLTEEEQRRVLDGMHAAYATEEAPSGEVKVELDVRHIPPPQRHPRIFEVFESLAPGEAFVLINDHDPKPLHYQFQFERAGQFTWEYLEEGPQVWRVRIGKTGGKKG